MSVYVGLRNCTCVWYRVYRQLRYCRGIRRRKKIVGRDSLLYTIASLSIETGIAPSEFINMDTEMFRAIMQVLADRAKELKNASKRNRR